MRVYKSYRFRDKDPAIDSLKTLIEDCYGEKLNGHALGDMQRAGGPTTQTMRNWFYGKTKRPSNCTLEAAGRSLGYMRTWVKQKRGTT